VARERSSAAGEVTRPTLVSVARRAGVSISTASLAFSGSGPVSDATRQRVLAAAAEINYAGPDPRARSLRQGRSGVVGLVLQGSVLSAFRDPVAVGMADGVTEVLAESGAGVLLLTDAPKGAVALANAAMDGVLVAGCGPRLDALVDALRDRRLPVVLVGGRSRPGVPAVDVDNRGASAEQARYLHSLGHREVATITLPLDDPVTEIVTPDVVPTLGVDAAGDRLRGLWSVFPQARAVAAVQSSVEEGLRLGRLLLANPSARPTAVVAQSDLLAVGVLRAAAEARIDVPSQLSVVGFDGVDLSGVAQRELTTMRQPMQDKGRTAARTILALISGGHPRSKFFPCELVIGDTTAPPAVTS
jgi:DNA-binding LacI/PurR family transcriptional regulator